MFVDGDLLSSGDPTLSNNVKQVVKHRVHDQRVRAFKLYHTRYKQIRGVYEDEKRDREHVNHRPFPYRLNHLVPLVEIVQLHFSVPKQGDSDEFDGRYDYNE